MIKLLKPILIFTFFKTRTRQLKKLMLFIVLYLFVFAVCSDLANAFELEKNAAWILLKWGGIVLVIIHLWRLFCHLLVPEKTNENGDVNVTKNVIIKPRADRMLKTPGQVIIEKHRVSK